MQFAKGDIVKVVDGLHVGCIGKVEKVRADHSALFAADSQSHRDVVSIASLMGHAPLSLKVRGKFVYVKQNTTEGSSSGG